MIQQTSILAFLDLKDLNARQQEVLNAIHQLGTACNLDIADYLRRPINAVTPRTNELVAKGLVEEAHRAPCRQTGRKSIFWRAK